mgnify:CR=1
MDFLSYTKPDERGLAEQALLPSLENEPPIWPAGTGFERRDNK